MATISDQQRAILRDILTRDSNSGYFNLTFYLKKILSGQNLVLTDPAKKSGEEEQLFTLSPDELWIEILSWSSDSNISLPMGTAALDQYELPSF